MGLFSSSKKTDPAYTQSQMATQQIAQMMAQQKLPDLPNIAASAAGTGVNVTPPGLNVPANLPGYLGGGANTTYQAGMPNQLSMIANQLTAGGYGAPNMGMYRAQTVAPTPPPIPPPAPAAPAPAAAPAAPAVPAPTAVAKPLGFTAQKNYGSGSGPFQSLGDFANFLMSQPGGWGGVGPYDPRGGR